MGTIYVLGMLVGFGVFIYSFISFILMVNDIRSIKNHLLGKNKIINEDGHISEDGGETWREKGLLGFKGAEVENSELKNIQKPNDLCKCGSGKKFIKCCGR